MRNDAPPPANGSASTQQAMGENSFTQLNAGSHVGSVENCEDVLITQTHLQNLKGTLEQLTPKNC